MDVSKVDLFSLFLANCQEVNVHRSNPLFLLCITTLVLSCLSVTSFSATAADVDVKSHQELIAKIRPSVMTIRVNGRDGDAMGLGTGFVIDSAGLIATNFHVIDEGRPFTVEMASGKRLRVTSVEASDRANDLVLIRVDPENETLKAIEFAEPMSCDQGTRVLAFGNPLGLEGSVVEGIVSAQREIEGRMLLQLAMPVEPGNSGGPLVDLDGRVHGIINMKSAIDDNLGFAIPIDQLISLRDHPNPVSIDRWIRLGNMNEESWTTLFGAVWQQRNGHITARGLGNGFGGRSLCLSKSDIPKRPFEISVEVRMDDEAGAAGLVFHSDGQDRHYGFYPSSGRLRLTCFMGPSIYSWQVLKEVASEHYLLDQWNQLKVRIDNESIRCFVNGQLVIESRDAQLTHGQVGLAKFRDTKPDFKRFQIGTELPSEALSESAQKWLGQLDVPSIDLDSLRTEQVQDLGESSELSSRELTRRAVKLEKQAAQFRRIAHDVQRTVTIQRLHKLLEAKPDEQLLQGALLIAALDNPDIDIDAYKIRIEEMAAEVLSELPADATSVQKQVALHRYLFDENGFHGSRSEYYHPANSHLNRVIDDREGLPITMSILYMELGRRLGLRIEGVGLPGHFVVKHVGDEKDDQRNGDQLNGDQLIDVFDRGKLLTRSEAADIVASHARRPLRDEDLRGSTSTEILTRVLNNLLGIAGDGKDAEAMLRYTEGLVAINPGMVDFRMMRAQLRGITGRYTAAREELDWLLENNPPELDRELVERMRSALPNQK